MNFTWYFAVSFKHEYDDGSFGWEDDMRVFDTKEEAREFGESRLQMEINHIGSEKYTQSKIIDYTIQKVT